MGNGRFLPGKPPGPGRPKGSIDSRTRNLQETLAAHGFNLGETWMDLLTKAKQGFETADDAQKPQYLKIASDITNSIADRMAPRLKAIEHKQTSPLDGLNDQQKLEMMKAATKSLEDQIVQPRDIGSGSGNSEPEKV